MDKIFAYIDSITEGVNGWLGQPAASYCKLQTTDGPHDLVAVDGARCSILKIRGIKQLIGPAGFDDLVDKIRSSLATRFQSAGHALECTFTYDPENVGKEIDSFFQPSRITARNLGLSTDLLFNDWTGALKRYCASEHGFLVLWTRPSVLPKAEIGHARKVMRERVSKGPQTGLGGQVIHRYILELRDRHAGFVSMVQDALRLADILYDHLTAHEALWWIRWHIDPDATAAGWKPRLPGDKLAFIVPDPGTERHGPLLYPSLRQQLFPREAEILDRHVVQIGSRIFSSVMMTLPPEDIQAFNNLFASLRQSGIPWRYSCFIEPQGLNALGGKATLAKLLRHFDSTSERIHESIEHLKSDDDVKVTLKITFTTWADDGQEELLRKRTAILASSIQGWGAADTSDIVGDPLLGLCATVPALMNGSPAPTFVAPLTHVIILLALTRPASPWSHGSVMLRTVDGKPFPYSPMSSLQASWIDVGVAPMGQGKSVLIALLNLGFILQPGLDRLPWLTIIDIGPSSHGLIRLVQEFLPEGRKHLAAYHCLQMTPEHSINPCDTPLGCRYPLPSHKSYLINFCTLLATPVNESAPDGSIPGLAQLCIERAYDELSPACSPQRYNHLIDEEVARTVDELGIHHDEQTTWWEIVDELFRQGHHHSATRAQRYAVPTIPFIAAQAMSEAIKPLYSHTTAGGEPIYQYFRRCLTEAIGKYPILKLPTKFDIGDTQIVSLDLGEVAPRGGPEADRQTAVMYMLARHVGAGRLFLMPHDVKHMPELYAAYHAKKVDQIRSDPKRFCIDEVQRFTRGSAVAAKQFTEDADSTAKESRKWNLGLMYFSQLMDDIPEHIVDLATSVWILGVNTDEAARKITTKFGMDDLARHAMQRLGKPDKRGSRMVVRLNVQDYFCEQLLANTVGPMALWAFSSVAEDRRLREHLYERLGPIPTLTLLAEIYAGGIKEEIERRRKAVADNEYGEQSDLITVIASELIAEAKKRRLA